MYSTAISGFVYILATPSFSSTIPSTKPTMISSSSTVDKIMPTSSSEASSTTSGTATPTNVITQPPTPPQVTRDALSGTRLSSPVHSILLLLLFITCILIL